MSKLIIIRGPLGIGKSTISKLVAKKINGKYYSIDDILSKNKLNKISSKRGCIPEKNFIKANEIAFSFLKNDLENNISVVIDGNFYHKIALEHLIKNFKKYTPIIFTLKTSIEKCIERDSKRINPHGKDASIAVYNLVSKFDYGNIIDNSNEDIQSKVNEIVSIILK